jgi:hypothetical protein
MSYDIYLEIDTGNGHKAEVGGDLNYTSNVSPMWRKAFTGTDFSFLGDIDGRRAGDCVTALRHAVAAMGGDPAAYEAMNPPNGWGDADGAREFLRKIADLCEQHPNCEVRVSR